jgi:hypothetical protein
VVAVIEAHRISLPLQRRPRQALLAESPIVPVMVAYTFAGLWVLGRDLSGGWQRNAALPSVRPGPRSSVDRAAVS